MCIQWIPKPLCVRGSLCFLCSLKPYLNPAHLDVAILILLARSICLWENRVCVKVPIPDKMCFLELKQLKSFVELLNSVRCCVTPGCSGALVPSVVRSIGLDGAISITFPATIA